MAENNQPLPPEVDWTNIHQFIQPFEEILSIIEKWSSGSAQPFAGLPRSTEPGYERRMREAYEQTVQTIRTIQPAPDTRASRVLLGHMWVQANGFASRVQVGGNSFDPEKGADHVLAGLPAIVAGRYRQLCQRAEGERGMNALADMEAKFGGLSVRPTHEEVDMCRDHRLEVAERSPDNPIDQDLFTDARWKAVQKARGTIAEKLTQSRNGIWLMLMGSTVDRTVGMDTVPYPHDAGC